MGNNDGFVSPHTISTISLALRTPGAPNECRASRWNVSLSLARMHRDADNERVLNASKLRRGKVNKKVLIWFRMLLLLWLLLLDAFLCSLFMFLCWFPLSFVMLNGLLVWHLSGYFIYFPIHLTPFLARLLSMCFIACYRSPYDLCQY